MPGSLVPGTLLGSDWIIKERKTDLSAGKAGDHSPPCLNRKAEPQSVSDFQGQASKWGSQDLKSRMQDLQVCHHFLPTSVFTDFVPESEFLLL